MPRLLNGAGDVGEDGVAVRPNQTDGADHDDENYGDHHCIFGNVLAILIDEQTTKRTTPGGVLSLLGIFGELS